MNESTICDADNCPRWGINLYEAGPVTLHYCDEHMRTFLDALLNAIIGVDNE